MLAYRTSVHESTDYRSFKLMFGREVRLPLELMLGMPPSSPQSAPGYVQKLKQDLLTAYDDARARVKSSQARQTDRYNHEHYQVGDRVWLFSTRVKRGQSPKSHSLGLGLSCTPFVKKVQGNYKSCTLTGSSLATLRQSNVYKEK